MPDTRVRATHPNDAGRIIELMRELAVYEKLEHHFENTPDRIRASFFGSDPSARCFVGEVHGEIEGYAVFFRTYSTFLGQPGLYLEDLYVTPNLRGSGLGKALLQAVAQEAYQAGFRRLDWAVLDWNRLAIDFYKKIGAQVMEDWRICRLSEDSLMRFAKD